MSFTWFLYDCKCNVKSTQKTSIKRRVLEIFLTWLVDNVNEVIRAVSNLLIFYKKISRVQKAQRRNQAKAQQA